MAVTAQLVKELREMTGAGMMDCKKVLVETDGNIDKAVELLREKGIAKAEKKAGRVAAEGLVRTAFSADGKQAVVIEVNSETDFVAKNEDFQKYVEKLAELALASDAGDVEAFKGVKFDDDTTVEAAHTNMVATIGENLTIRRFEKKAEPGVVYTGYIHGNGKIGVLVGIKTEASADEIQAVGKDVAMQVASMSPKFLDESDVDADFIAEEKRILAEQVRQEGKPENMVDKIVEGKIKKELKEYCLVEQKFVKDNELTVKKYVEQAGKEIGKDMTVASFVRYEVGEGIEKKEDDFAAEVASMSAGK